MAKSGSGDILHAVAVRYRITGEGNFETFLRSDDDVRNVQLADLALIPLNNRLLEVLANFQEQSIQVEGRTLVMDEWFFITKIIVYVKPVAQEYPL